MRVGERHVTLKNEGTGKWKERVEKKERRKEGKDDWDSMNHELGVTTLKT